MGKFADMVAEAGGIDAIKINLPSEQNGPAAAEGDDPVASFIDTYRPAAERKAKELGVSPVALLSQAALETGFGRHVVPGTNNLFNVKDFSGGGVEATDNQTGSRDKYRAYASPDESFDDHARLLTKRYRGALNTGDDVGAYFRNLKAGGYAEDPEYVKKGLKVADMIRARTGDMKTSSSGGGMPDANRMVGGAQEAPAPEDSNFVRGAKVALGQTPALLKGLVGLGGETLEQTFGEGGIGSAIKKWGLEGYKADMAKLEPLQRETDSATTAWEKATKNGDLGALLDWASYGLGYGAAQVGETVLTAIGGAAIGGSTTGGAGAVPGAAAGAVGKSAVKGFVRDLIEKSVAKKTAELMEKAEIKAAIAKGTLTHEAALQQARQAATKEVAQTIGSTAALSGYNVMMEGGSIYPDAVEQSEKEGRQLDGGDLARIWGATAAAAATETLTDKLGIDAALGKVHIPGTGRAGRAAVGGLGGMAVESGQEGAQTAIERYGAGKSLTDEEARRDIVDSAAMGGLPGGVVGAGSGVMAPAPQRKPHSPLSNAVSAATEAAAPAAPTPAAPTPAAPTPVSFGAPELDKQYADVQAFINGEGNLARLRSFDPGLPEEALHIWRNVINNPGLPLKTRVAALQQAHTTMLNLPNFVLGGAEEAPTAPSAPPATPGAMPVPVVPAGGMGPVDPAAGSIPGESRRIGPDEVAGPTETPASAPTPSLHRLPELAAVDKAFLAGAKRVSPKELVLPDGTPMVLSNAQTARWLRLMAERQKAALPAESENNGRIAAEAAPGLAERGRADVGRSAAEPDGAPPAGAVSVPAETSLTPTPEADGPRAYGEDAARKMATRLTRQGMPTEAYAHPTQPGKFALRAAPQSAAPVEESADEKSHREWAENYSDVAGDIKAASDKNIERAIGYAGHQISAYQPRAWAGDERAKTMIDSLNREIDGFEQELKGRREAHKAPPAAVEPAPAPVVSEMDALREEMGQAIGELASLLGVKMNMTAEEEARLIPVMSKIFRIAARMGYVKFKDAAVYVVKQLRALGGEALASKVSIENLQAGYINIAKEIGGNKKDALEFDSIDELMGDHDTLVENIAKAEKTTDANPSEAQKEAENYRKGKFDWNGLTIAVETAKGGERSGKGRDGEEWHVKMPATYGYILGTLGADKDHVDIFMGDHPEEQRAYIIDQNKPDSDDFDEHKVMAGFRSAEEAQAAYLLSFTGDFGARVFARISEPLTIDELKEVLPTLKRKKPFTEPVAREFNVVEPAPAPAAGPSQLSLAVDNTAPAVEPPANWRKSWNAAVKYAEALGVPVRNAKNKYKKVPELIADIDAKLAEKVAPGTRSNTPEDAARARRIELIADALANSTKPMVSSAVTAIRWAATELRKPRTGGDVPGVLQTAAERLYTSGFAAQSEVIAQVVDQLRGASEAAEEAKPAPAAGLDGNLPDVRNTPPMETLDGFRAGDLVDIPGRTIGRSRIETLFHRNTVGMDMNVARVVSEDGKRLDVLTSELRKAEESAPADESPLLKARNDLIELQTRLDAQGRIVDARLMDRVAQQKRLIAQLEKEEAAAHLNTVNEVSSLDELVDVLDRGQKAHFDYAGADGRTLWVEQVGGRGWVLRSRDDDNPGFTITKGGAGLSSWGKGRAIEEAKDNAQYRFTEWKPVADTAPSPIAAQEPHFEEAKALMAAQKAATGNAKAEAEVRRKARELAAKTPLSDERTVTALDIVATRLDMGEGGKKALEFLPAVEKVSLENSKSLQDTEIKESGGYGTTASEQGTPPLAGVATQEVRGVAGGQSTGDRSERSGARSGEGNPRVDGRGGEAGRSGGNRSAEVHPADAGAAGRGRLGSPGTGGTGSSVPAQDGAAAGNGRGDGLTPPASLIPEANFEITAEVALGSGGQMTKYRDNVAAIKLLKGLESERRRATAAEKRVLARYVGWGGIPNAFRNGITGQVANGWEAEVAELESLLTPTELRAASASTRNAHYTAQEVVNFMWAAVCKLGFAGGMVVEPAVGTGNFIGLMPKEVAGSSFVIGIELDSLTARIASALYPRSSIINTGFQKAALPNNRFQLAIGNPPFGKESLRFQFKPELNGASIHNQFFLGTLDAVEPGGLMSMVVSRYLMDAKDATTREKLATDADLVYGVRLPGVAFKGNALTEVVTDVLIFRKREPAEAARLREALATRGRVPKTRDRKLLDEYEAAQGDLGAALAWTQTKELPAASGEPMVVSRYFADRPAQVLGVMDRSGSMRHEGDIDVKLRPGETLTDQLALALNRIPQLAPRTLSEEALKNTEKFNAALGESLRLVAMGAESDSIYFDDHGDLSTVIERTGEHGETALTTIKITPNTPWSQQIQMDLEGRWFHEVAKVDEKGQRVKNGRRNVYERHYFKSEAEIPEGLRLGKMRFTKIRDLIAIRDLLVKQIDLEVTRASAEQMEANRTKLRTAYQQFVGKHGYISEGRNASIVSEMPDEGLLMSLETGFRPAVSAAKAKATGMPESPASAKMAAILTRPVAIPPVAKTHADTPVDALAISMSETGRIDLPRIATLRGLSEEEASRELTEGDTPLAFRDPESGDLIEKNAYLSGNVRRKLEAARQAGLDVNVRALEKVQPEPWTSDKVTAKPGANWIPAAIYSDFLTHLAGAPGHVSYARLTNTFEARSDKANDAARLKWSTKRVPLGTMFTNILNSSKIAVYDTDSDGNRHLNQVETDLANEKAREIREEFDNWIFKDVDRRAELTKLFNDQFNTRVTPQYDGSHLTFPGKVPDDIIALRRGQTNAIWRGIIEDYVLYDHAVGAGKTFTGIARAMERRRMGLSKKPMVVVPNHLVGEWAAQVYRLYPGARVLAATKKDLEAKNRRRLFAKVASGDWDLVIIPHSSFQFISISPETEERILLAEMANAEAALKEAEEDADPGSRFKPLSVKEAEALIENIQTKLDVVRGQFAKDRLLTFEQMGVDDLTIDESHEFKNLFYSSRLTDVRGMGTKIGSNKAFDLYTKTRVIRENNGAVAFMTGTPISNSAVELYTILRYLAPGLLQESGLENFDAFRSMYVDATAKFEPTDTGGGLKLVTRLGRSWSNMRSLMELYYTVADVVTNDDIKRWYAEDNPGKEFPLPRVKGGDRIAVSVKPTPTQLRILEATIEAFEGLDAIEDVKERNAQRLRLMDRARKVSLHAKAVDPNLNDEPGGKLDVVAEQVASIYKRWDVDKGTQLVFIDRGVPKSKGDDKLIKEYDELRAQLRAAARDGDEVAVTRFNDALEKYDANEMEELRNAQATPWSAYQHIKDRLVAQGIPEHEIAFVQNFNGDAAKEQLFQLVRDGTIRVLLGSSPRMGAGTNVQERLVALHHVDATWKPSDIEQREGRIIRQGNLLYEKYGKDFEVEIYAYVTERTVDAKLWDLNSTKLRMINAVRYYDGAFEMDFDDEAAVGMAEIAAIASGDPLLLERFRLATEIDNLYRQKRSHRRRIESAEDAQRAAERTIEQAPALIAETKEDAALRDRFVDYVSNDVVTRSLTIEGTRFTFDEISAARVELARLLGDVGDDEKINLTINGKVYTSKGGAEEAISLVLGDAEPFVGEVDGQKIIRRSDFARAIRKKVGDFVTEGDSIASTPLGTIGGIPVAFEAEPSWGGGLRTYLGLTGTYASTGRRLSHVGGHIVNTEKRKSGDPIPLAVTSLRPVISDFEKTITYLRDNSEWLKSNADRAVNDLPQFIEQAQETFKHQEELDAKEARLKAVEAELNGRKAATAEDSAEEVPSALSRAQRANAGEVAGAIDKPTADSLAAKLLNALGATTTNHVVVETFNELPEQVQADARAQGSDEQTTKGVFHQGTMYLVADNIKDSKEIEETVFHEMIGHLGVRKALGPEFVQKTNALFMQLGGIDGLTKIAAEHGFGDIFNEYITGIVRANKENPQRFPDAVCRAILTEEVFAHMAEQRPTLYQKAKELIGWVRDWLRRHGFAKLAEYGETDILYLLNRARKALRDPNGKGPGGGVTPAALSKAAPAASATQLAKHAAAIATMRDDVRDNTSLSDFPGGEAAYNLYEASQMLPKPSDKLKHVSTNNSFSLWQSYDYIANVDGDLYGVTKQEDPDAQDDDEKFVYGFNPLDTDQKIPAHVVTPWSDVPSLLQAIHEWKALSGSVQSGAMPSVLKRSPVESMREYVSTPEGRKALVDHVSELFGGNSPKTFNVLHKTIASQFHKAKVDRHFGRVFSLAQQFLDDVARFGSEAADLAPGLLPKMDTLAGALREVRRYRQDKADAEAIAASIFDGTLYEDADGNTGKVWSDEELRSKYNLNERQIGLYREFRKAVDHSLETLAMAEMHKIAKANELVMPDGELNMRELSDFYAAQFGGRMRELETELERLKKQAETDGKIMMENAAKLGKGREAYHEAMKAKEVQDAAQQQRIMNELETLKGLWDGIVGKKNTILKLEREGYAPLMRFGKYTVDVVEKVPAIGENGKSIIDPATGEMKMDDKRHFFGMFESVREANEAARIMAEEYPQAEVSTGVASDDGWQLFGSVNPDSLEMLARLAGKEDEVIQKFYKEAVSSRSALKRLIHRQGIAGYSQDVTRSLASFLLSNARATASAKHFGDLMEAAADIPKQKGDVKDEAVKLINYIRNPNEEAGALRGLLFMQFLGGSVASAAVNLTQTMTTTFPFLHQYGAGLKDVFGAARLAGKRMGKAETTGDSILDSALSRAEDEGVVSPHNIHALMGETSAQGMARNRMVRLMTHVWGSMFGMAEQFNRETAFIAAFRLAERLGSDGLRNAYEEQAALNARRGLPPPDMAIFRSPYTFAKNAVNETQFVLSKAARPNWARGTVGATVMTFKQFSIFYIELLKRLPNKERALMLATLAVLAGVGGLPGADDLDDIIDTLGQAIGYDTNAKMWRQKLVTDVFGKSGGDFVNNGISAFLPIELATRLGMGNLIPASGVMKKSNSGNREREVTELIGAAGGYYKQLSDAWDYTLQQRYGMALTQAFLPKAIKDASKAVDMARTGAYDDTHGRRVTDVTTLDALIKALGFQPTAVSEIQQRKGMVMQDIALVKSVKASIAEIWAQGIHDNDPSKKASAQRMLHDWNAKNPENPIDIKRSQVMQRVRQMSKTAAERMIKTSPKELRGHVASVIGE